MGILLYLFNWNGDHTIINHHLIGLKIILESYFFVLSAAAVAAEVAAALPTSDIH